MKEADDKGRGKKPAKKPAAEGARPDVMILKITLRATGIVRVLALPSDMNVYHLEGILLTCFGFDGDHLFAFNSPYLPDYEDNFWDVEDEDMAERRKKEVEDVPLRKVFPGRGDEAVVEYDFGDGWKFMIRRMADAKNARPFTCRKSVGIDAMDDCGGPCGLLRLVYLLEQIAEGEKVEGQNEREFLEWAFGEDRELTPEFAKEKLTGPTADEITARLGEER